MAKKTSIHIRTACETRIGLLHRIGIKVQRDPDSVGEADLGDAPVPDAFINPIMVMLSKLVATSRLLKLLLDLEILRAMRGAWRLPI